ncbi:hypothetical protein J9303_10300 [Bacillaceae bacterium Marseille-Q3522]|nr:hypothetical protein [Bacillaceae bacterium Marseille-Q3522]
MGKKVFILFTDTGTWLTKIIKLYTKHPFNHVSLAFDEYLHEVYSFGRKSQRNPFIGGFVKEDVRTGIFRESSCAIYSCYLTDGQFEKMQKIIANFDMHKQEYKYNLLGLFAFIINKNIERDKAFFCSEFVATILNECGVLALEKPASLVTPQDIMKNGKLRKIFQGKLSLYAIPYDIGLKTKISGICHYPLRLLKKWTA